MVIDCTPIEVHEARLMAEAVNGGSWDSDYTDAQKSGWILKARWAATHHDAEGVRLSFGETSPP